MYDSMEISFLVKSLQSNRYCMAFSQAVTIVCSEQQFTVLYKIKANDWSVLFSDYYMATCLDVGWLCLTSHRQRGHLATAPPFTTTCLENTSNRQQ